MATVNVTNYFQNVSDLGDMLNIVNLQTQGRGWLGLALMMHGIIFLALLPFGFLAAAFSSSFIMLVAGTFLTYLGLLSWQWLMLFLGEILFLILYSTWQEG